MSDKSPYEEYGQEPTLDDWANTDEDSYIAALDRVAEELGGELVNAIMNESTYREKKLCERSMNGFLALEIKNQSLWVGCWAANKLAEMRDE